MEKKIIYLSKIRSLASLAIVILHTFTMYHIVDANNMTSVEEYMTRLVPFLMMWAVPCFVMVSGALLLNSNKNIGIKKIFSKYILRIILILIIFTLLFFYIDILMTSQTINVGEYISTWFKKFISGKSWAHMWYLYMLIGIYLMLPLYRIIAKHATKTILIYIGVVIIFFISVIEPLEDIIDIPIEFYIFISSIFPVYLFVGYMIHNNMLKFNTLVSSLLVIISIICIVLLTLLNNNTVNDLLGNYSFIPVISLSVGIYSLLHNNNSKLTKLWLFIDKYSFSIYLTHLIYLRILIRLIDWNPLDYGSFWMLFAVSIGVFILSLLTSMILKLIPGLKKII